VYSICCLLENRTFVDVGRFSEVDAEKAVKYADFNVASVVY